MSTSVIVLIVIAVLALLVIAIHNAIIGRHNAVQRAWADVIAQERQKNKILPALEEIASRYADFEKGLQEKITALRSAVSSLSSEHIDTGSLAAAEAHTQALMSGLKVAVEAYPDLKASDTYNNLMREITEQQENIGAAIRIFNRNVEQFNTGIEVFPNSLVNSLMTHKHRLNVFDDSEAAAGFEYKPNF